MSLTPEQLLAEYGPKIGQIARDLRDLVVDAVPGATERAYPGWRAIGYRTKDAGYFAGIFLFDTEVKLIFEHGHALPDPEGILEGTTRQTRHLTFKPGSVVPAEAVKELLVASVAYGQARHASAGATRVRTK